MRKAFWKADWFIGAAVVLIVLLLHAATNLFEGLDARLYDASLSSASRAPSDKVAIVAIDNQSIENLGRWPWPRDVQARMIDLLSQSGAKVVANTTFLFEAQRDPGLSYLERLQTIADRAPVVEGEAPADARWTEIQGVLAEARLKLDTDKALADSMRKAGNVLTPFTFAAFGTPQGKPDKDLPDYINRNLINVAAGEGGPVPGLSPQIPRPEFGAAAAGIGTLVSLNDADGVFRLDPVAVEYYGGVFPSMAVLAAAKSLNLEPQDIRLYPGRHIQLGNLKVSIDAQAQMRPFYYSVAAGQTAFSTDSFFDVYSAKIGLEKYRGKIVLIGATAAGLTQAMATPVDPRMSAVEALAHSVSSILQEHFVVQPGWADAVLFAALLLVAAYLMLLLPRLKAGVAAGLSALLLLVLVGASYGLMVAELIWVPLMMPASVLLIGHLLLTTIRFLTTERGKEKSEAESAESNRMLGLAFQGQGQLDMAFDKFRKCPLDDSMLDILYNLALDFERKRQFNKSGAVFEYMARHNPRYKDLEQRLKRAKAMEETVILGAPSKGNASTLVMDAAVEKPMLGRYQVEKELGKGAMGVVYLGRDPKISRVVAIKTMALSQEFDADELQDVRERFFREAETAGRLNHPNIVTIYDAGEEHDLAYIAMEFLKGKDLVPHSKPANLLPLPEVLAIVRQVADALGYAHSQNVVHRDIKPANIMYEALSKTVKVTDFGIARITDSSRTKTGLVLGTPSYMSPEQLSGKKIDGRSDLFSLAVTLYQLSVGQLPFRGESMAELMFRIANEPHRNIRDVNPAIPITLSAVINRALAKDPAQRFQSGKEFAEAIRQCEASLDG